jgi:peptidoglycan/xylan/chitin deacetylase (PgdA/CDA1 family)
LNKESYNIYIRSTCSEKNAYKWIWSVFCDYLKLDYSYCTNIDDADFIIGEEEGDTILVNNDFWRLINEKQFDFRILLNDQMFVCYQNNSKDYLSTAFYFINCIWERSDSSKKDQWGRSEFSNSIWAYYGYQRPFTFVNQLFDEFAERLGISIAKKRSKVFLSHDIDTIYGAIFEDFYHALKQKKVREVFNVIFENVFKGHQWINFETILKVEEKYNMFSTFFWLPVKGKVKGIGKNADYKIDRLKSMFKLIESYGGSNGLHKSIAPYSIQDELEKIPFKTFINRNHYLKFNWCELQNELEVSQIKIDASLGYAEMFGYRNGYSLPFVPFDLSNKKSHSFIEIPLTIMDGTFSKYLKKDVDEAFLQLERFIEDNEYNSIITVLWHNSHFTEYKYKGYRKLYEKLLIKFQEKGIVPISPQQILENFKLNKE